MAAKKDASMYDAVEAFVEHMHKSADALEELVDVMRGEKLDPEDRRAGQDTVMEFGFLPASNESGSGGSDGAMYLEGSQMFLENSTTPILTEGSS